MGYNPGVTGQTEMCYKCAVKSRNELGLLNLLLPLPGVEPWTFNLVGKHSIAASSLTLHACPYVSQGGIWGCTNNFIAKVKWRKCSQFFYISAPERGHGKDCCERGVYRLRKKVSKAFCWTVTIVPYRQVSGPPWSTMLGTGLEFHNLVWCRRGVCRVDGRSGFRAAGVVLAWSVAIVPFEGNCWGHQWEAATMMKASN